MWDKRFTMNFSCNSASVILVGNGYLLEVQVLDILARLSSNGIEWDGW